MWYSCGSSVFLSLCCLFLWPSVTEANEANGVPGSINYTLVTSEVVDLLRVRITWPIPKYNITEYRIEYCTVSSSCNTITVSADSNQLLQPSVGFVSYVLEHGASLNTSIDVTLSANNDNGAGSTGNGPVSIPVATYDDARPVNIITTVLTSSFMVVVWNLPADAGGAGITVTGYSTRFILCCSTVVINTTDTAALLSSNGSIYNGTISVVVTPLYSIPVISDLNDVAGTSQAIVIPQPDADQPLMSKIPDITERLATQYTVNWQAPSNTQLLDSYNIAYTSTVIIEVSSRRKRASGSSNTTSVPVGTTSIVIPTCPYCDVTVTVSAVYVGGSTVPLLETTRFTTPEAAPSVPRQVQVARDGSTRLRCDWVVPNPTNGIITNYIVLFHKSSMPGGSARREGVGSNDTSYTIIDLAPNTQYFVVVIAETEAGDGIASDNVTSTTGFGVTPPPRVSVNGRKVEFTLSRTDGAISRYQVIVSRSKLTNTTTMTNIPAYSTSSSSLYVTRVGDISTNQDTVVVDIGTGVIVQQGGVMYTDKELNSNTDYYIFIRVFSSIDGSVFGDSVVYGPTRVPSGVNAVAIAVPIVVVYLVIMVFLAIILIICVFFVRPAWKLRRQYNLRKQEAERRQQQQGKEGEALVELGSVKEEDAPHTYETVDVEPTEKEQPMNEEVVKSVDPAEEEKAKEEKATD